jgi:predicted porin
MKKSLIAAGVLAMLSQVAMAEDGVSVYGIMDVAAGKVGNSYAPSSTFPGTFNVWDKNKAPNSQTGLINGGMQASRFGFKGSEDLGSGMKAFFQLESGFNLPTGATSSGIGSLNANSGLSEPNNRVSASGASAISGQLFARGAFVGLSDKDLGKISFGRQTSIEYDELGGFDPLFKSDAFSPLGFSGTPGGGGGSTDNSRWDNSIKYKNTVNNFNYSMMVKIGADAGSTQTLGGYTAQVGYDAGNFAVTGMYTHQTDAVVTGLSNANAVAGDLYNLTSYILAAKYKVSDEATIKGGWEHYERQASSTQSLPTAIIYGTSMTVTPYNNTTKPFDMFFVGGDYNVTHNLNVAVGVYNLVNQAFTKSDGTTVGSLKGNEFAYSFLADYHFTKRTDVYAGLMYVTFDNGALSTTVGYNGGNNTSNYIAAVGMRHKF